MKIFAAILAALAVVPVAKGQRVDAVPVSAARWQRILVPPANNPTAEQCALVDADLYAHAAPGLRDVRLLQDGRELPYAMDVSFDTRVGEAAPPPPDDRAIYQIVQVIALRPQPTGIDGTPPGSYVGESLLSAHVPMERIRLDPAPPGAATIDLYAAARMNLRQTEEMHATLTSAQPAKPFTIGANLQEEADVLVRVHQPGPAPKGVVLEMRRRELCYRPRSASPIRMLLGNTNAQPARYDYALHFQPSASPLMAAMGPLVANPAYRQAQPAKPVLRSSAELRLGVTAAILLGSCAAVAFALYELRRK